MICMGSPTIREVETDVSDLRLLNGTNGLRSLNSSVDQKFLINLQKSR